VIFCEQASFARINDRSSIAWLAADSSFSEAQANNETATKVTANKAQSARRVFMESLQ
jgi:hypothetical protein